jgi:hypothetical protein
MAELSVYALFHLNLAFSSIDEDRRGEVIERCYWPLLRLAEGGLPLAIEASGYTLDEITARDPAWIETLRGLIEKGRAELVGSGYAQLIGPLVPAGVNGANLRLGQLTFERLFGIRPRLALVNEQAYSAGLVPLYRDAGFSALVMDYDGAAHHHPEWPKALRYAPQRVEGPDGTALDLIWTNTIAFQKLQRLAHGELELAAYTDYVRAQMGAEKRAFPLYGNDAEVFDFRPGRLATEAPLSGESEWARLAAGLRAARALKGVRFVLPSQALADQFPHRAPAPLKLETARCPIPVKKQHKYNVTRWAVTGRDDLGLNTRCHALYEALAAHGGSDPDWRTLCYLWSSDFRTHVTERRWKAALLALEAAEARFKARPKTRVLTPHHGGRRPNSSQVKPNGRFIEIETAALRVRLNRARGLAIDALWLDGLSEQSGPASCGTLLHGDIDDLHLAFDWYSGTLVYDRPAKPKVTDLQPVTPEIVCADDGSVVLSAEIETPLGLVRKRLTVSAEVPAIDYEYLVDWHEWGPGSLRLGNFTLLPEAFDRNRLFLRTHNGGRVPETFALTESIDHGAPVSLQVSASCALGLTEGVLDIGDAKRRLAVSVDKSIAALIGMLTLRTLEDTWFCRVALSALEFDETSRPGAVPPRPRRFRFSIGRAA